MRYRDDRELKWPEIAFIGFTLLVIGIAVLQLAACGKTVTAPPPSKSDGDPHVVAGATIAPDLFPLDSGYAVERVIYFDPPLCCVMHTRADGTVDTTVVPFQSNVDSYHIASDGRCDDIFTADGFVGALTIRVDWYIGHRLGGTAALADTLAHYRVAPFDPFVSPLPGWGDDLDHPLRWSLRIDGLSPRAPDAIAFAPSAMPGYSFLRPMPQSAWCSQ